MASGHWTSHIQFVPPTLIRDMHYAVHKAFWRAKDWSYLISQSKSVILFDLDSKLISSTNTLYANVDWVLKQSKRSYTWWCFGGRIVSYKLTRTQTNSREQYAGVIWERQLISSRSIRHRCQFSISHVLLSYSYRGGYNRSNSIFHYKRNSSW